MNKFNKLYNLILLSIITEDINSKIKKAIDTLIKSGLLKDLNDPRALQVKTIIKRNSSIDINGKTKLSDLLKANLKYTIRAENYLDTIKEFSLKKEYSNGVVVYKVEDSKAGQAAVRKIVDAQWDEDCNPWCLISRDEDGKLDRAWNFWKQYNAYPKHIAFQNGKLLAFCANDNLENKWWDRLNDATSKLILLDGSLMKIRQYKYSFIDKKKIIENFLHVKNSCFRNDKDLYNSHFSVMVNDINLIDGKLPVKFDKVDVAFDFYKCKKLISLEGAPKKCTTFSIHTCPLITNLLNCPNLVSYMGIYNNKGLTSLKGITKNHISYLTIKNNPNLIDSSDLPINIKQLCVDNNMPEEFYNSLAFKKLLQAGKVMKVK